jgi:predicted Rossmann-fold nucleotide-binding protein
MSDEQQTEAEHYREIAEQLRKLAQQTRIREAQEELFDLADQFDRMAELARSIKDKGQRQGA